MKILDVQQGSDQWLKLREDHYCASDAPAMMGASSYKSRDQLLQETASGIVKEVDARTQALFDRGHETEAMARVIIEKQIGEDLYPAVIEDGDLLASLDGMTMGQEIIFEHKLWNEKLAEQVRNEDLDPMYYWQLEHQILVSGAKTVIFVVSDGTEENMVQMVYTQVAGRANDLAAGWIQFGSDLDTYEVVEQAQPEVKGTPVQSLPALNVKLVGEVMNSNLALYEKTATDFVRSISTDLQTDQDFADAENLVKFCTKAEEELKLVKSRAQSQAASIDDLFNSMDRIREELRQKRLTLDKLVKSRKAEVRVEIISRAKLDLLAHVDGMPDMVQYRMVIMDSIGSDFPGVTKGKKSVATVQEAVNDELARCKIQADQLRETITTNDGVVQALDQQHKFLFPDATTLILKEPEDFAILVQSRIDQHDQAEKEKEAAKETERKQKLQSRITTIQTAAMDAMTSTLEECEKILARLEKTDPVTFEERDEEGGEILEASIEALKGIIASKQREQDAVVEEPEKEVESEPLEFGTLADKEPEPAEEPVPEEADVMRVIYGGGRIASGLVPDLALACDGREKGWLFARHPDGHWVSIADMNEYFAGLKEL